MNWQHNRRLTNFLLQAAAQGAHDRPASNLHAAQLAVTARHGRHRHKHLAPDGLAVGTMPIGLVSSAQLLGSPSALQLAK
jgi:hypothetical protein